MALSKQDRDQIIALQVAQTSALLSLLDTLTPAGVSNNPLPQGANPPAVQEFIDRIVVPSAGADPAKVAEREANLRREQERLDKLTFNGLSGVKATSLDANDLAVMRHFDKNSAYRHQQKGKAAPDLYETLLVGTHAQLVKARNDGEHSKEWEKWRNDAGVGFNAYKGAQTPNSKKLIAAYDKWISAELA